MLIRALFARRDIPVSRIPPATVFILRIHRKVELIISGVSVTDLIQTISTLITFILRQEPTKFVLPYLMPEIRVPILCATQFMWGIIQTHVRPIFIIRQRGQEVCIS